MISSIRNIDIIASKRDGKELSEEQISAFIASYASGDMPDYQASAWCMAVLINGMSPRETGFLTRAMINSGDVMDLSTISGPFVDKHSTGGVGDKISLILAPVVAACGVKVPMMSGRALGHTGGTLDKLESIPGYTTALSPKAFAGILAEVGFAMTGQSETMVPADRKMYALRDVSATVESIPLITGSILSKKFAEGADALVMDVKCGSGAFMKTQQQAEELAHSLIHTGQNLGKRVIALISDMSEPLGRKVGNFLEVEESLDTLCGDGPPDVLELTLQLSGWMLVAAGLESEIDRARERCRQAVDDGLALEKFRENIAAQGGRLDELDAMVGRARTKYSYDIVAQSNGFVSRIDAFSVGMASVALGVGRNKASDTVSALSGIELFKKSGEKVTKGEPLMRLWAEEKSHLGNAQEQIAEAVTISPDAPPKKTSLILKEISS